MRIYPLCLKKDLVELQFESHELRDDAGLLELALYMGREPGEIELLGFIYTFTCMKAQHLATRFEIRTAAPKSLILIVES